MTTKITIANDSSSNGDILLKGVNTCEGAIDAALLPGNSKEFWITNSSSLFVTERWPSGEPKKREEPLLGLATTAELLNELRARCEINGTINYRTVGGEALSAAQAVAGHAAAVTTAAAESIKPEAPAAADECAVAARERTGDEN